MDFGYLKTNLFLDKKAVKKLGNMETIILILICILLIISNMGQNKETLYGIICAMCIGLLICIHFVICIINIMVNIIFFKKPRFANPFLHFFEKSTGYFMDYILNKTK